MSQPYDLNELLNKFKSRGLVVAESVAKSVVEDVLTWAEESIRSSPNPFDDVFLGVLPTVKKTVLKELDKIDGVVTVVGEA